MLLRFYGLDEQPFGVTPDPRFLYFTAGHREALAALYYAIEERRGFSALVAKPGMGKTTLLFRLLESLQDSTRTAFLFQTGQDSREFLDSLVRDLGISAAANDLPSLHEALNEMLVQEMEADRRVVVVIDEAQNLSEEMLEAVRLLSNFETPAAKMIHIVLAGQPALADKLAGPALTQLRQRVGSVAQLQPLNLKETKEYVEHRLRAAGFNGAQLFTSNAVESIARISEGIPRNINSICFQSLSLGFVYEKRLIDSEIVREVARDLELKKNEVKSAGARANPNKPEARQKTTRVSAESTATWPSAAPSATWPSLPAPAQTMDFGYYGMPHASTPRSAVTSVGIVVFLMIFLPLLTVAALTKVGVVNADGILDSLAGRAGNSSLDVTRALPVALRPPAAPPIEKINVNPEEEDIPLTGTSATSANGSNPDIGSARAESGGTATSVKVIRLGRKETVSDLATEYYGTSDKSAVQLILSQNPKIRHAYQILPAGTQLIVPVRAGADGLDKQTSDEGTTQPQKQGFVAVPRVSRKYGTVRVQRDETLFQFAMEELGKGDWATVRKIRAANPQIRDPFQILAKGQWIKLPEEIAER
jgi:type II secretory pathway predicted ATPase ExeA/phage tail protein X